MPFKPVALSQDGAVAATQLDAQLAGIGVNLDVEPDVSADIEVTLCCAARAGMLQEDWRVLGVLVCWWQAHHRYVHAERLIQLVESGRTARLDALWSALANMCDKDRRLRRLGALHEGEPLELLAVGNSFQVMRRGEDPRFVGSALRVPAGVLRERAHDVLSPERLVAQHPGYKNRVLFGPSWRADLWTVVERDPALTPAQAARAVGCAFSTAWAITRDFALLHQRGDERVVGVGVWRGGWLWWGRIESAVRQVLCMRVKGAGKLWREEQCGQMRRLRSWQVAGRLESLRTWALGRRAAWWCDYTKPLSRKDKQAT